MIETTATRSEPTRTAAPGPGISIRPGDVLISLIVAILAPMFLTASGGDIGFARLAAMQTVKAYRARDNADLISIAQIIACGLVSLGSLGLSLADNLSLSMTLRLRGNAVALNRSADLSRRAIRQARDDAEAGYDTGRMDMAADPDQEEFEAKIAANLAVAQQLTAEARAQPQNPQPQNLQPQDDQRSVATPAPAAPVSGPVSGPRPALIPVRPAAPTQPTTKPNTKLAPNPVVARPAATVAFDTMTDQQRKSTWAAAMADVAGEFTASLIHLPPKERKAASIRAAILSSCANTLITGETPEWYKSHLPIGPKTI